MRGPIRLALWIAVAAPLAAFGADYRATADPATILYDAPSTRSKPLFVFGRDGIPAEQIGRAHV